MLHHISKIVQIVAMAMLFSVLSACSDDNDDAQQKPTSNIKSTVAENITDNVSANNEARPTIDDAANAKENLSQEQADQAEIKQQLAQLKQELANDNQDNAALRQHMLFLMEKVKENEQTLEQQEQKITPKAE